MTFVEPEHTLRTKLGQGSSSSGLLQIVLMYALQLRQELCEVFILCDVQGCSIAEVAELLLINSELVAKRLKKARSQMEEVVARLWDGLPEAPSGTAKGDIGGIYDSFGDSWRRSS
jgi:DNA-directed RNA polymerase specialized sigma24 family protein